MFTSSNHWSQFKYHSRTLIHRYMCVCNDSGREWTGTGEAYIALSLHVGSFVQEHLHHFNMTIHNGVVESSVSTLSETDTHCERAYIHTYMDIQTCNSWLYSASRFYNALHNATLSLTQTWAPLHIFSQTLLYTTYLIMKYCTYI